MKMLCCFILLLLMACSGHQDLAGFDENAWKKDKNGCNGIRSGLSEQLEMSLESIKGLSENEVLELLGSPDVNQLHKRNQKFYIYHITPSLECGSTGRETQEFLEIRFSATNLATEVMIKEFER